MCFYCKCKETKQSINTHVVTTENSVIVIKDVPCLECAQCGEKYYTDEIMGKLENVVEQAKKMSGEVFVTEYNRATA
ncbi:MAG: type II toxin-antitoxin system MqsA family antitoxin [Lachnospiraceae bacterium]|nr:type II toxin-antitoxin system MqsA family antitoxin [Lachnospiraceae bacterium]